MAAAVAFCNGLRLGGKAQKPMYFSIDGPTLESPHQENAARLEPKTMTDITRDELFAKMDSQSSKLDARLAEMRADMAVSRREQSEQIGRVAESVAELRGSVVGLGGRLDGSIAGLNGRIDGLVSSMTMLQWCIGAVGLAGGIWIAYQQLKLAEVPPVASVAAAAPFQMPPIIISVPASVAPPAVAPAPK